MTWGGYISIVSQHWTFVCNNYFYCWFRCFCLHWKHKGLSFALSHIWYLSFLNSTWTEVICSMQSFQRQLISCWRVSQKDHGAKIVQPIMGNEPSSPREETFIHFPLEKCTQLLYIAEFVSYFEIKVFTARTRSLREGNVFSPVCLSVQREGHPVTTSHDTIWGPPSHHMNTWDSTPATWTNGTPTSSPTTWVCSKLFTWDSPTTWTCLNLLTWGGPWPYGNV